MCFTDHSHKCVTNESDECVTNESYEWATNELCPLYEWLMSLSHHSYTRIVPQIERVTNESNGWVTNELCPLYQRLCLVPFTFTQLHRPSTSSNLCVSYRIMTHSHKCVVPPIEWDVCLSWCVSLFRCVSLLLHRDLFTCETWPIYTCYLCLSYEWFTRLLWMQWDFCVNEICVSLTASQLIHTWHMAHAAQEWTNRTVIGHEPLICSKTCFTKTELVQ